MWFSIILYFERNYDLLQSKTPCIFLNKNINFNKNETESKMEKRDRIENGKNETESKMKNPTNSFRETNIVLKLI